MEMKTRSISWRAALPLCCAAAAAGVFALLTWGTGAQNGAMSILAFPFQYAGTMLEALTRLGAAGNGLAAALWLAPAALMLLYTWNRRQDRSRLLEHLALVLLAFAVLYTLYLNANTAALKALFPLMDGRGLPLMRSMVGSAAWSCAALYLVLRLTRAMRKAGVGKLTSALAVLLFVLGLVFALDLGAAAAEAVSRFGAQDNAATDQAIVVLRVLTAALSASLSILVVYRALEALDAMRRPAADAPARMDSLAAASLAALVMTTAASAVLNLAQLLLARSLKDIAFKANLPMLSLAFALATLLFARIYAENRRLQEESELIV